MVIKNNNTTIKQIKTKSIRVVSTHKEMTNSLLNVIMTSSVKQSHELKNKALLFWYADSPATASGSHCNADTAVDCKNGDSTSNVLGGLQ
ncbi:MAG: hypothetical protein ACXQTP_01935 [Candidatus Methanofastidiosia archaeon]